MCGTAHEVTMQSVTSKHMLVIVVIGACRGRAARGAPVLF